MKKTWKFIGGMRAETWNATFPFAKILISPEAVEIHSLGRKYIFRENDVIGFKNRDSGVQIFHNKPEYPTFIIFWHSRPSKVIRTINQCGFVPKGIGQMDDGEYDQHNYLLIAGLFILMSILGIGLFTMLITANK